MKDYKRILQGVVNIINITKKSDIGFANICTYIGENCPELKESEDERIRKAIIEFFELQDDNTTYSFVPKKDIIAWLEKQGEKHIDRELSNLLNRVIHRFINDSNIPYSERDEVSKKIIPYVEQLKKQGEQKPADKGESSLLTVERAKEMSPFMRSGFENESVGWSEEDEKHVKSIISTLEYCKNQFHAVESYNADIDWLKSLKDRVQPQPKQEWNEEDKETVDLTIAVLKENLPNGYFKTNPINTLNMGGIHTDELIEKLKSLRHQNTWKPSDEQIGVIEAVINNRSFQRRHLDSLYEQLKKLREE